MKTKVLVADSYRDPDIYWASGFLASDPFVYVENERQKWIIVSGLEYGRAQKEARNGIEVVLLEKPTRLEGLLDLLKRERIRDLGIPHSFPAFWATKLTGNGYSLSFEKEIFPERAVKTAEEIEHIREVQHAIEEVFDLAVARLANATIREGVVFEGDHPLTSEELRSLMDRELHQRGCINLKGLVVASGDQAVEPHHFGSGPIRAHSPIVFDIFPQSLSTFYWSDMSRTVAKGKLDDQAQRMYRFVKEAQELGLSMVREGAHGRKIHMAIERFFERNGKYRTSTKPGNVFGFIHGTGHGVGLDIHEAPRVSKSGDELKAGHVITIEPGLYYPGLGGMRIEDTVLVTKDGHENLAKAPKDLLEL